MNSNNKGLTLVELVVTLAIVGLVSVSIISFMVTASNQYRSSNSEINLQFESQVVINQIQDLIIDATQGLSYAVSESGGTEIKTVNDRNSTVKDLNKEIKRLYIYNKDSVHIITWKKATSELYYSTATVAVSTVDSTKKTIQAESEQVLMAKYVSEFSPDLTRISSKRSLKIDLKFETGSKKYDTYHNVSLRNDIVVNAETVDDIYIDEDLSAAVAEKVTVIPGEAAVLAGNTKQFKVKVESTAGDILPSNNVLWEVIGAASTGTFIDQSGNLTVGIDETAVSITVKATSTLYKDADNNAKFGTALVELKNFDSIVIAREDGVSISEKVYQNDSIDLMATVNFTPLQGVEIPAEYQEVIWSIEGNPAGVSINSATGMLTISALAQENSSINVVAAWKKDSTKTTEQTINIGSPSLKLGTKNNVAQILNRNGKIELVATVTGMKNAGPYVKWSYELKEKPTLANNNIAKLVDNSFVTAGTTGLTNIYSLKKSLDFNTEYTLTVTAKLEGHPYAFDVLTITIKKVAVIFERKPEIVLSRPDHLIEELSYTIEGLDVSDGSIIWRETNVSGFVDITDTGLKLIFSLHNNANAAKYIDVFPYYDKKSSIESGHVFIQTLKKFN